MVGVLTEMARVCADEEVVNTAAVAIQVLMDVWTRAVSEE